MEGAKLHSPRPQQPRQGMLPVPWTATGQDGPNWLHANVPTQPHAKSLGSPCHSSARLTITDPHTEPQQTRPLPATRCPRASSLHPSASSHPRKQSGMDKCQQQVPAVGLPLGPEPHHGSSPAGSTGDWEEARRCFSRNEVRRKVFLTKNCSLCLSVSGVNSLDIGMISPLRMIMALQ